MPATAEPSRPELPELIDLPAMAERFGVTPRTIRDWVRAGTFPSPVKLGARSVWTPETVARFLNGQPLQIQK
jgi:predicted DNA-binding transcriptional regulator AlpA